MASESITRDEFLHYLAAERSHLIAAIAGLSEEEMCRPNALEKSSIKDILAHIAFWDEQATKNLELVLAGKANEIVRPADDREVDAWNQREWQRRQSLSLAEAIGQMEERRSKLLSLIEEISDELLNTQIEVQPHGTPRPLHRLLAVDTFEHDREHAADIQQWRQSLETSKA